MRSSIKLIGRILQMEKPVPIQPFRDLSIIHRKRSKRIKRVEARLEANDASISLEALYRGLLRDQEAGCHKIMAVQRQLEEDRKQLAKDEVAADREAKIFQQVFEQRMQQKPSTGESDSKETLKPTAKPTLMKTLPLLIGFILAWFFASSGGGCRQSSERILTRTLGEFGYSSSELHVGSILPTPSILSRLVEPRTVQESLPERRKPADPGNAC